MAQVIEQLKEEGQTVDEADVEHLWPPSHEHINVHGKIQFNVNRELNRQGRLG